MKDIKNHVMYGMIIGLGMICGLSMFIVNDTSKMYKNLFNDYSVMSKEYIALNEKLEQKETTIKMLENEIEQLNAQPKWTAIGKFRITAYGNDCVGCTGLTKSGTVPQEGRTIAVDPTVIPLGSEVYFNGNIYIAEDIGGAIKGNVIDLFYGTEQESIDYGVQYHTVYVKEQVKWKMLD